MKYKINGQEFIPSAPFATIGELFEQVRTQSEYAFKIVTQLSVDGEAIMLPDPGESIDAPQFKGGLMEVILENPGDLLLRSIKDADELLTMMIEESAKATEAFRESKNLFGHEQLSLVLDKMALFMDYVDEVLRFVENTFEGFTGAEKAHALFTDMISNLKKVMEAQQNKDDVLLADLLEFEMAPNLLKWRDYFSSDEFVIVLH